MMTDAAPFVRSPQRARGVRFHGSRSRDGARVGPLRARHRFAESAGNAPAKDAMSAS